MITHTCGGKMTVLKKNKMRIVYQCDVCKKILVVHGRTATSGNQRSRNGE